MSHLTRCKGCNTNFDFQGAMSQFLLGDVLDAW